MKNQNQKIFDGKRMKGWGRGEGNPYVERLVIKGVAKEDNEKGSEGRKEEKSERMNMKAQRKRRQQK